MSAIEYAGLIGHYVSMHIGGMDEEEDSRLTIGFVVGVVDWDASPNVDIIMKRDPGDRFSDSHTIAPGENWRFHIRDKR